MKKLFCLAALCGLCIYAPAHAADVLMDDIVISANKIETSASEATSSVTVITEEDREAQQARTFVDALKNAPGLFMGAEQGAAGLNTIKIRGSHQRYTQLRYNGIPLRESGTIEGNFDSFYGMLNLAPGVAERIEILKGAQSTLYGSSATGGVISIYGGSKWDSGFNTSLDLNGGSYGTFTASGQISYGDDKWYVNFMPLYTRSDGFKDIWYEQGGFSLNAGLRLTEKTSIELTSLLTAFENASVSSPWWDSFSRKWSKLTVYGKAEKNSGQILLNGLTVNHEVNDWWNIQGKAAFTRTERNYRHDRNEFFGNSCYFDLLNTFRPLDRLTVVAGTEYEGQSMELRDHRMGEKQDESAGAFSAYTKGLLSFLDKKLVLSAGGRFNKHEDYDSKVTWDLGLAYSFDTGTRVFGNVATGFYSPSLYQRYGDGNSNVKGNPDLDSESSISYELGVEQKLWQNKLLLTATVFATEYDDQVAWDYNSGWPGSYYNAPEAKARGFELGLNVQPNDMVRFDLGYTRVSAKEKREGAAWEHSLQIPDNKLSGTLYLFPVETLKLSVTGRWEDARKDSAGTVMDDAFFTVDIAATYDITNHLQIYAKVNNLLDEDYAVYGWEMPGINAMAGARFKF